MKSDCEFVIREMKDSEIDEALELMWKVFRQLIAPEYSKEGIDTFYTQYIKGKSFREKFASQREIMYGAFIDEKLVGVLSLSANNAVSCLFVEREYHRMGIGKQLFEVVIKKLRDRGVMEVMLNASSYAIPFYTHLGFSIIGEKTCYKGMIYTPMKLVL